MMLECGCIRLFMQTASQETPMAVYFWYLLVGKLQFLFWGGLSWATFLKNQTFVQDVEPQLMSSF